ncbi:MAG: hypothetical protein Q9219_002308 [cf. Caloplaca sp. 3 TL-2023]
MTNQAIIDSHIHLYPSAELQSLAWCPESHPLHKQYSIEEYLSATQDLRTHSAHTLKGFIFIETDRKSSLEEAEAGWEEPLRELDWIKRIADGFPREGEGHGPQHAQLCLGIVLWAPLPLGPEGLARYVDRVKERAGRTWQLVKGFRYLVQDKPAGTMLGDGFVESLRWMGRNGYVFDLGVDARRGGIWQLSEAVEMIEKAHEGAVDEEKVVVVINHLCKPDMRVRDADGDPEGEAFNEWSREKARLASFPQVYMKVSGCFSEIDGLPPAAEQGPLESLTRRKLLQNTREWVEKWLKDILTSFGSRRTMFGSDWPVCNVGGGGDEVSWINWWSVVENFVKDNMSGKDQSRFWGDNAVTAYGLSF